MGQDGILPPIVNRRFAGWRATAESGLPTRCRLPTCPTVLRIADKSRLPFEVKLPNATTRKATAELEAGKGRRFASTDALMADLNADD